MNISWMRLLKYFTWLSVICFLVSAVTFSSSGLMLRIIRQVLRLLKFIFPSGLFLRILKFIKNLAVECWIVLSFCISFLIYGLSFYFKKYKRSKHPVRFYKIEFLLGLGSIFFLLGLLGISYYETVKLEITHYKVLIFAAFGCYGFIGYIMDSSITWTASLISLGLLLNVVTGYDHASYYIGIIKPKLVCLLGIILMLFPLTGTLSITLSTITQVFGCLYFFISIWILSLWEENHYLWNFAFISSSILIMCIGLKKNDHLFSRFGLVFLLIEIYTLFFENFWSQEYKSLFFFVLGLSFFGIGFYGKHCVRLFGLIRKESKLTK